MNKQHIYYGDAIVGADGIVYSRNWQGTATFEPITKVNEVDVPMIKELIRVNNVLYLTITVDGGLFSLRSGVSIKLEAPIVTGYVVGSHGHAVLLILEDGRLRMVDIYHQSDQQPERLSVNYDHDVNQDRLIDNPIVMISPIYDEFIEPKYDPNGSGRRGCISYAKEWLVITDQNQWLIVNPEAGQVQPMTDKLDYRTVVNIREGLILTNDSRLHEVRIVNGKYILVEIKHQFNNLIDAIPMIQNTVRVLTSDHRLYHVADGVSRELINDGISCAKLIRLMITYQIHRDTMAPLRSGSIIVQGENHSIYGISSSANAIGRIVSGKLLTRDQVNRRVVKPVRSPQLDH